MGDWNGTVPTILGGDVPSGDDEKAITDELAALSGAWTAYTPVWAASGTAVALGNGTITGRYNRVGKMIDARITLTMGSTTTYGTGFYTLTLPVAPLDIDQIGSARFFDAGVLDRSGTCYVSAVASTGTVSAISSAGVVGPTSPHTWGAADVWTIHIRYEAA